MEKLEEIYILSDLLKVFDKIPDSSITAELLERLGIDAEYEEFTKLVLDMSYRIVYINTYAANEEPTFRYHVDNFSLEDKQTEEIEELAKHRIDQEVRLGEIGLLLANSQTTDNLGEKEPVGPAPLENNLKAANSATSLQHVFFDFNR